MLVVAQAAVAAVIASTAWAAGQVVEGGLRRLGTRAGASSAAIAREVPPPLPWPVTMALGFAVLGQALTLAGLAGILRRPVVVALVIGVNVAAVPAWRRVAAAARAASAARRATQLAHATRGLTLQVALAALSGVIALTSFLLTLYPPLGFDQTVYHLPFTRAFVASGGLPFLPALRLPMFPPLSELLNAAVLMFAGDVATQAVGWVALVGCVGLAYAWASELQRHVNLASARPSASASSLASGSLAAAVVAGSPIAFYLASTGYVEPLLALLGGASLYAACRADTSSLVAVAGLLAGSAASVKYHGLYFVPAAAILILTNTSRRTFRRDLIIYAVAATGAMLPCYGRLLAETGNPVYPFYPELFGQNPWGLRTMMGPSGAQRWWLTLTRLWDVTFRREAIGHLPHYSPAFLAALPVIAAVAWRHRQFRLPLLIAIGYMVASPTHAHYLFTISVLWAALFGAAATIFLRARTTLLIATAVILACGGEAYALHRLYRLGPPPVTSEERDRMIASQRPLYPAVAWINRHAGPVTVYAINAEMMLDYASGTLLGDFNGPDSFDLMEGRVRTTGSVAAALDTIGASYLLVPVDADAITSFWNTEASRDPRLERVYADSHATVYGVKR